MLEIEKAMIFIQGGIEKYHYSHNNGYEIMYGRNLLKWRMRPINKGLWEIFDTEDVIYKFNTYHLNLAAFQAELNHNLLTKATYLRMELKKLENALGKENIDKAEADWANFGKGLVKLINTEMVKKNIKVIEGGKND